MIDDHQVLRMSNDAYHDLRVICRDHRGALNAVARRVKLDAQSAQSRADFSAGDHVVFSNSAGEDQHVQPA